MLGMSGVASRTDADALPQAGRIASQVKQGLDLDAVLADAKKEAIRKTANEGAPDIRQNRRKCLRVVQDAIQGLLDAKDEVIAEAKSFVVVPVNRLSQVGFGRG
jgi:hypothetical protein